MPLPMRFGRRMWIRNRRKNEKRYTDVERAMFMKSPDYYTYKQHTYQCKSCGWEGLGLDLRNGEMFDALFELNCPSCFEMVTFVPYPSSREPHGEHLSESGRSMIDSAKSHIARFNAMCLKSPA